MTQTRALWIAGILVIIWAGWAIAQAMRAAPPGLVRRLIPRTHPRKTTPEREHGRRLRESSRRPFFVQKRKAKTLE